MAHGSCTLGSKRWLVTAAAAMLLVAMPFAATGQPAGVVDATVQTEPPEARRLSEEAADLERQGKYKAASLPAQQALRLREEALGPDHPQVATGLYQLSELYQQMYEFEQGEALARRALTIREKLFGQVHPAVAQSLFGLAKFHSSQSRFAEAESLHRRALSIREKALGPEHSDVGLSLNALAGLYREQGDYPEAERLIRRALAICEKALGPEHAEVAAILNHLFVVNFNQGRFGEGEVLLRRAVATSEKALGPNHPTVARYLNNLTQLFIQQGRYEEGEALLLRSIANLEKAFGAERAAVVSNLGTLGEIYLNQGRYTESEQAFQRFLLARTKAYGPEHPQVSIAQSQLASLYSVQGRFAEAETLLLQAQSIRKKVYGPQHPMVSSALNALALLQARKGNLTAAVEALSQSLDIQERFLRLNLPFGTDAQKLASVTRLQDTTDTTLSLHLQQAPRDTGALRLALTTLLRRKGRVLDALGKSLNAARARLQPEQQPLLDQLVATRSRLANLVFSDASGQSRTAAAALEVEANNLEAKLNQAGAMLQLDSPPVTIDAVQRLLPTDSALVEWVRYRPLDLKIANTNQRWQPSRYAAYVLLPDGTVQAVDLGEAAQLDKEALALRALLGKPETAPGTLKRLSRRLDARWFAPVRKLTGGARHLLVAPDGQINLLPLAALVDERGQHLIERYTFTYLGSGRDLLRLQNLDPPRSGPVLLADPAYDQPGQGLILGKPNSADSNRSGGALRSTDADFARLHVARLGGVVAEAQQLQVLLPGIRTLTGSQASERALKQVHSPALMHIATHGFFFNEGTPEASKPGQPSFVENPLLRTGLALAGFNNRDGGDGEDGVLTALEVSGLDLRGTKLAVLSACDTGVGSVRNGEGVYGLRRALVIAGAQSQLLSLWKVNDWATQKLMQRYYQELLAGVGRSEALRRSQLAALAEDRRAHPAFWAAFVPSGDWRPLGELQALKGNALKPGR